MTERKTSPVWMHWRSFAAFCSLTMLGMAMPATAQSPDPKASSELIKNIDARAPVLSNAIKSADLAALWVLSRNVNRQLLLLSQQRKDLPDPACIQTLEGLKALADAAIAVITSNKGLREASQVNTYARLDFNEVAKAAGLADKACRAAKGIDRTASMPVFTAADFPKGEHLTTEPAAGPPDRAVMLEALTLIDGAEAALVKAVASNADPDWIAVVAAIARFGDVLTSSMIKVDFSRDPAFACVTLGGSIMYLASLSTAGMDQRAALAGSMEPERFTDAILTVDRAVDDHRALKSACVKAIGAPEIAANVAIPAGLLKTAP